MSGKDVKPPGKGEEKKEGGGRRGTGRGRKESPAPPSELSSGIGGSSGITGSSGLTTVTTEPEQTVRGRDRGATRRAGAGDDKSPQGGSSPGGEGSPPDLSPERLAESLKQLGIAPRAGYGTRGNKVELWANHHELKMNKELVLTQYSIDITHPRIKINRDMKREVFWQCVKENRNVFGDNIYEILYDGDKLCIAQHTMKFPPAGGPDQPAGMFVTEVSIKSPKFDTPVQIRLAMQMIGLTQVNLQAVSATGNGRDRHTMPLAILDILFRQNRACPATNVAKSWYPFGSTVYRIPVDRTTVPPLGGGIGVWQGLFDSVRLGERNMPFVNFDVAHSGFYIAQNVIDFMIDVLNLHYGAGRFHRSQLNAQTALMDQQIYLLNKEMKGVNILTKVRPHDKPEYERHYRIGAVAKENAFEYKFECMKPNGARDDLREISVNDYFAERYGGLLFPKLPLLFVGNKKKSTYLPMERCFVLNCQRFGKKLRPDQTTEMIKVAAMNAPSRRNRILELVNDSRFGEDPWLKQYGVRVNPEMTKVQARVLPALKIEYRDGEQKRSGSNIVPVDIGRGSWEMRGQKFYIPSTIQKVGLLVTEENRPSDDTEPFFAFLLNTCKEYGMTVPPAVPKNLIWRIKPGRLSDEIDQAMNGFKTQNCDLVFVVIPAKGSPLYPEVKRVAEITYGIMTQCVTRGTVAKAVKKQDRMTTTNIALKMNTKMGGVNWKAQMDQFAKKTLEEVPTLVLGVDVTHPAPTERKAPSIVSIVGNLDDTFMRYAASIRVQKHRRESVLYLQEPVRDRILDYFRDAAARNKEREKAKLPPLKALKPERIIVYRDGVAETQFVDVLRSELKNIRDACTELGGNYSPSITLIVGQKRHHTRFFPTSQQGACGKGGNVYPGTVVDSTITHPTQFEFYLCSHFGLQGTSRPIRYHVLTDDSRFTADHIQAMTYYFTHCFARCTRPVSLPAPQYYADLACRRARAHLHDKIADFSSDTMSRASGTETGEGSGISEDELVKGTSVHEVLKLRMYFT